MVGVCGAVNALLPFWWTGVVGSKVESEVIDVVGVRGVRRFLELSSLSRREGVWGNKTELLVGDFDVEAMTGNGTANSRRTRFAGDLEGDLLGDGGGPGSERDEKAPLGDAEAKVRVRAESFDGMAS